MRGFSLLEVLTAITILSIIMLVTASVMDGTSKVVRGANAKIESFQSARAAFDSMTAKLSQATLNTYWDYFDSNFTAYRNLNASAATGFIPFSYGRYSDLHFICGPASQIVTSLPMNINALSSQAVFFTCPTGLTANASYNGMPGLLTACGYFVAFGNDQSNRPSFLNSPPSWRWRLMELSAPTETLSVFSSASGTSWITNSIAQNQVRSVAENVIALIVWPRLSTQDDSLGTQISSNYQYDSRTTLSWTGTPPKQPIQAHQLPPTLNITMVVIDEISAKRLENGSTAPVAITGALSGLFTNNVTTYQDDLDTLEKRLTDSKITFRTFNSTIALKEAKWAP